jgi:outer membrane protein assembly factor BamB
LSATAPFDRHGTLEWEAHAAMPSDLGGMIGSTAVGMSRGRPAVFASSALPFSTRDPFGSITEGLNNFSDGLAGGTVRIPPGGLHAFRAPGIVDENNTTTPGDEGSPIWDAAALPAYGAAVYVGNLVFLPDTFGFALHAYDADTGRLVWTLPTVGPPASPPAFLGDTMYFGSGIPQDGSPLSNVGGIWAFSLPPAG